eukprot:12740120-Alexandrium_andersonii.AAC.1
MSNLVNPGVRIRTCVFRPARFVGRLGICAKMAQHVLLRSFGDYVGCRLWDRSSRFELLQQS